MTKLKCRYCGGALYSVPELITDPEGLRHDYWCEQCKVMFTTTKAEFVKRLVLQDRYSSGLIDRLQASLSACMMELERLKKFNG